LPFACTCDGQARDHHVTRTASSIKWSRRCVHDGCGPPPPASPHPLTYRGFGKMALASFDKDLCTLNLARPHRASTSTQPHTSTTPSSTHRSSTNRCVSPTRIWQHRKQRQAFSTRGSQHQEMPYFLRGLSLAQYPPNDARNEASEYVAHPRLTVLSP
jgi:hypothetical protein